MKTTTKIFTYIFTGAFFLALNSGCKKLEDFGDTNVNPNGSTVAATADIIAAIETRLGSRTFASNDAAAETLTGFFCQYFAEPTYPGSSRYSNPQVNSSGIYAGPLYDCKVVIDRNTDPATAGAAAASGSNASQIAMCRVMKAYMFWIITDRWGDMPYTQALQGLAVPQPKYDTQESIYTDILKELTEAVDQFDETGVKVKGDLIYNGDIGKWKRFTNSLRMLVALRMSKVYPNAGGLAATEFAAAANPTGAGFITSNADNFQLYYPGNTTNYNNPWFGSGNSADLGVAQTYTDALQGLGDTRLASMASNNTGVPYGLDVAAPTSITFAKILGSPFKQAAGTMVYIAASHILLAQAEAIERGWIAGDAKAAYDAGVTASFAQWNATMPGTYLTSGVTNFNSGAGTGSIGGSTVVGSNALTSSNLARIQLQQWIAFYPNANQGYANWRRTGVPDIKPTINPVTSHTEIPRRLTYGTNEYSLNEAQVTIAAAQIGGDDQDTRVWWDKP